MSIIILTALLLLSCRADRPHATDLDGHPVNPFSSDAQATVLLFVQTDCPISNRYAPTINTGAGTGCYSFARIEFPTSQDIDVLNLLLAHFS
jgi:hypothetical protein